MSYNPEHYKERSFYWHEEYNKANRRSSAAIAEAKKSKERELTAIRMMLELKKRPDEVKRYRDMLSRINTAYCVSLSDTVFVEEVWKILEELNNE